MRVEGQDGEQAAVAVLNRRVRALPEGAMRAAVTGEWFMEGSPAQAAERLWGLIGRARHGDRHARASMEAWVVWFSGAWERPEVARWLSAVHQEAQGLGLPVVAALCGDAAPCRRLPTGARPMEVCFSARARLPMSAVVAARWIEHKDGSFDVIPMRYGGPLYRHLLKHPDPVVIQRILDEPAVTPREVMWIAARRPGLPAIAWTVARHGRWFRRAEVRLALAANPYTPTALTVALMTTLPTSALRSLRAGALHPDALRALDALLGFTA